MNVYGMKSPFANKLSLKQAGEQSFVLVKDNLETLAKLKETTKLYFGSEGKLAVDSNWAMVRAAKSYYSNFAEVSTSNYEITNLKIFRDFTIETYEYLNEEEASLALDLLRNAIQGLDRLKKTYKSEGANKQRNVTVVQETIDSFQRQIRHIEKMSQTYKTSKVSTIINDQLVYLQKSSKNDEEKQSLLARVIHSLGGIQKLLGNENALLTDFVELLQVSQVVIQDSKKNIFMAHFLLIQQKDELEKTVIELKDIVKLTIPDAQKAEMEAGVFLKSKHFGHLLLEAEVYIEVPAQQFNYRAVASSVKNLLIAGGLGAIAWFNPMGLGKPAAGLAPDFFKKGCGYVGQIWKEMSDEEKQKTLIHTPTILDKFVTKVKDHPFNVVEEFQKFHVELSKKGAENLKVIGKAMEAAVTLATVVKGAASADPAPTTI